MDRLARTPLLLFEVSRPSVQHTRPGGFVKSSAHRERQKTSAAMPTRPGADERRERSFVGRHFRLHQKRDREPAKAKRDALRVRREGRPSVTAHVHDKRKNPQAKSTRLRRRGNPQAPEKTEIRESPSKLAQRPTLPKTPKFFSRGDLMRGRRV